ncbi:hypothetical protein PT2222_80115 [Paraburkholderia tropica]
MWALLRAGFGAVSDIAIRMKWARVPRARARFWVRGIICCIAGSTARVNGWGTLAYGGGLGGRAGMRCGKVTSQCAGW